MESLPRIFMRLTLPIMSMVITLSLLLPNAAGQLNTLVNFGSALPCLGGQFSVGANTLGQNPLRAPSVFNWFQPEYSPAGELAEAELSAPEMQITHETTLTGYNNFLDMTIQRTTERFRNGRVDAYVVDYSPWIQLAAQPEQLLDQLDTVLMNGQLTQSTRSEVLQAIKSVTRNLLDIPRDDARVHLAVRLLMASPEYLVQK